VSRIIVFLIGFLLMCPVNLTLAEESDLRKELEMLKKRMLELEAQLKAREESKTTTPAATEEKEGEIEQTLKARFGSLSIHGGAVGYYQGRNNVRYEDGEDFGNPDGFGIAADLELGFKPMPGGELIMRLHFGEGDGADRDAADRLFANLNTIADDNPGDDRFSLLDLFYTQSLLDEMFFISVGKTEPLLFMDENAYANDEVAQFIGKPFVNDPVLDSEDEYAPLVAVGMNPSEALSLVLVCQSSSWPQLDEEEQKSKYEEIFDQPFFGAQVTWRPKLLGREGNYRVYGWTQTYDHPKIKGEGTEPGWGVGLSLDHTITDTFGLFARLGYHNDDVYDVPFSWSVGANLTGFISGREDDELGFGVAGLHGNDELPSDDEDELRDDGVELHLEIYYRIALSDSFAITPDLQYVMSPLGNDKNDDIFVGMIRAEWGF
jgi:Carbohydrate-selective porin, OprB family